jgi:tRNA/tmRNA/rRNA uracil-C5-methylase (TrmA/RlmC/RlmD family)
MLLKQTKIVASISDLRCDVEFIKDASKYYIITLVIFNQNAKLNGLTNCEFVAGDVAKAVKNLKDKPDLIIVDPPRPGVHKDAVRDISNFGAKEIVYISCNPKTLVLDLVEFKKYGYELEKVKCMDMFPNTPHVETIVKLIKK